MLTLCRTVRLTVDPAQRPDSRLATPKHNTFAGWPPTNGLPVYYEVTVACRGEPNPTTGYLADITEIDEAVRRVAIPSILEAFSADGSVNPAWLLRGIIPNLVEALPAPVVMVSWQLTPYHRISMSPTDQDHVILSQQFEFAAAHRLHSESLSEQENQRVFGKCNSPNSHGHNYRVQVEVRTPLSASGQPVRLSDLEEIVFDRIIRRFDHRNLNLDTEEFREVNPSVEHIARTCYHLLADPFDVRGGRLERVTVWETERTSCTYEPQRD